MGKTKKLTLTGCLVFSLLSFITVAQDSISINSNSNGSVQYDVQTSVTNTHVFTLTGDGFFSMNSQPSHNFAENSDGYTTTSYFVKPYNVNKPPKKTVNTDSIASGGGGNKPVRMNGNNSTIINSWSVAFEKENFFILAFQNLSTQDTVDGCVGFHYHTNFTVPDTSKILAQPDWVSNRSMGSSSKTNCNTKIEWDFTDLLPGEQRFVYIPAINYVRPGNTLTLHSTYDEGCDGGGSSSSSSSNSYRYSHDPNSKEVDMECLTFPADQQRLGYTISFYNDGTGPAQDIFVLDLLEDFLDPSSVELTGGKDLPKISTNGQLVTFEFENIFLPGIDQEGPESFTIEDCTSYFSFTVCTNDPIIPDMCISNVAEIIFDSNSPIMTTVATVCNVDSCEKLSDCDIARSPEEHDSLVNFDELVSFDVAPNPFSDQLLIDVNFASKTNGSCTIDLIDFSGKQIRQLYQSKELQKNIHQRFNLDDLPKGIYMLRLTTNDNNSYTKKIIKQ